MVAFIAVVALVVSVANKGFQQGQDNPQSRSFFQSSSHIVRDTKCAD
jgi:hypothetical protein